MTPYTFPQRKVEPNNDTSELVDLELNVSDVITLAHQIRTAEDFPANDTAQSSLRATLSTGQWFLLSDVIALLSSFVCGGLLAYLVNLLNDNDFQKLLDPASLEQFAIFSGLGVMAILWLDVHGHYRQRLPYWENIANILGVTFVGFIVCGFIQFALKNDTSRLWLGFSWVFFAALLFIGRSVVRGMLDVKGLWKIKAIVIGEGATAQAAVCALKDEPELGYEIVRIVPAEVLADLGKYGSWGRFLRAVKADYLFLALEGTELERFQHSIKSMARERVPYSIMPPWMGLPMSGLSSHQFMMHDVMMMHDTNRLDLLLPGLMKRCFDVVAASAALLVLSPVFLLVSFMVRKDGGDAFYSQPRMGRNGTFFKCLKFRSMRSDADQALEKHLVENPEAAAEWAKFQKLKNDPRITAFGQFIRKTSIDELPQLINVLKGEMSLVGPRPILPGQEVFYADDFVYYQAVRPGITGPWQVSGRNRLTFNQRVSLEAWYTRNWTMWLDIVIILKTVPALLKKDTAF